MISTIFSRNLHSLVTQQTHYCGHVTKSQSRQLSSASVLLLLPTHPPPERRGYQINIMIKSVTYACFVPSVNNETANPFFVGARLATYKNSHLNYTLYRSCQHPFFLQVVFRLNHLLTLQELPTATNFGTHALKCGC